MTENNSLLNVNEDIPWPGIVAGSKQFKEFMEKLGPLKDKVLEEAMRDWQMKYGGITPGPGEFGSMNLIPELFETEWGRHLSTWMREFHLINIRERILMKGAAYGCVPESFRIVLMGVMFMGRRNLITEWWIEAGSITTEKRKPVISYEDFPIVNALKEPISLKEGEKVIIKGIVRKGGGRIRVIPIGFSLYKRSIFEEKGIVKEAAK